MKTFLAVCILGCNFTSCLFYLEVNFGKQIPKVFLEVQSLKTSSLVLLEIIQIEHSFGTFLSIIPVSRRILIIDVAKLFSLSDFQEGIDIFILGKLRLTFWVGYGYRCSLIPTFFQDEKHLMKNQKNVKFKTNTCLWNHLICATLSAHFLCMHITLS